MNPPMPARALGASGLQVTPIGLGLAGAVAIAAVLANPWLDVVLSGAITTDQLSSNLAALSVQLSADEVNELAQLAEPSRTYWSKRQSMPWG
jgi:aryl-alcohol dehydrogenase-like predicted oxidoreductase